MSINKPQKFCLKNSIDYLDRDSLFKIAKIYKIHFKEVVPCYNLFCFNQHPLLIKEIDLNYSVFKLVNFVIMNMIILIILYPIMGIFLMWCKFLKFFTYLMMDDNSYKKYEYTCSDIYKLFTKEPFIKICDCNAKVCLITYRWYPDIKKKLLKKVSI